MFELPVRRERKHGYVFEVPASATGMVEPVPLRDMGRFEHEACAVDPDSGVVFLTEDKHRSLFYRFIPTVPGKLAQGGQLQALVIADRPSYDTRNWSQADLLETGQWLETSWIDIEEPDSRDDDLRLRGFRDGAARFARGEGLCYAGGSIFVTCTIGGPARLGQVFEYRVSNAEGTADESLSPGKLRLLAEATTDSLLRNADNLTMSPWGDLIVCEDTADHCGLVGIRPDGIQYRVADNSHTDSELAGVCFSPDGSVLFVNIQERGLTLAITGPWPQPSA
jgi:secreted PhoX family phosphatase